MTASRLETFSDGVLAIVITIMVLELGVPDGESLKDLWDSTGVGEISYLLSFIYVGIYWNNHHHLFQLVSRVNLKVLWANLAWLFWLSQLPFTTRWMNVTSLAKDPVFVYGINLFLVAFFYRVLIVVLLDEHSSASLLNKALGENRNVVFSLYLLGAGIGFSLLEDVLPNGVGVALALVCFVAVAVFWFIPDPKVAEQVAQNGD